MKPVLKTLLTVGTISFFTLLVLGILLVSIFSIKDKTTEFLSDELIKDSVTFKVIAISVLSDPLISEIVIQGDNPNRCEQVNHWSKCPKSNWRNVKTNESLDSLSEVLQIEGIEKARYDSIITFLSSHQLKRISKPYREHNCIDFEASYNGLRYSNKSNSDFNVDYEYVVVTKINANWFSYERDWN